MKEYKERQYDIDLQLQDHTSADENYYITASTIFSLAKRAKALFESSEIEEKRAILNYLLQNCTANGKNLYREWQHENSFPLERTSTKIPEYWSTVEKAWKWFEEIKDSCGFEDVDKEKAFETARLHLRMHSRR